MSDQSIPPVGPYQGPYPPPQYRAAGHDPRVVLGVFVLILAMVAIVVLVLVSIGFGGDSNTPEGTLEHYAAALNEGDARDMLDQTVLCLSPDYESWVEQFQQTVLEGRPHLEISNVTVIDREDFTVWQQLEAEDAIEEISDAFGKTVEDCCFVRYTAVLTYEVYGSQEFDGEVLCLLIDGTWYLDIRGLV